MGSWDDRTEAYTNAQNDLLCIFAGFYSFPGLIVLFSSFKDIGS